MAACPNNKDKSPLESLIARQAHAVSKAEVTELATILTREVGEADSIPGRSASNVARELLNFAVMLQLIAEFRCNGIPRLLPASEVGPNVSRSQATWYECDEAEADRLESEMRERAAEILKPYKVKSVSTGGDPRGYPIVLKLASGKNNSWAGEGYGLKANPSTRKRSA